MIRVCGRSVPVGNYSFVADDAGKQNIYEKLFDAEKILLVDYIDFARKMRVAFEAFALDEETGRRQLLPENKSKSIIDIKDEIHNEIWQLSTTNSKKIALELCSGREKEYEPMLMRYGYLSNGYHSAVEIRRGLKDYIWGFYKYGSTSSHEHGRIDADSIPNKVNSIKAAASFHDFLCVYYGKRKKYQESLIPLEDYIPIPAEIVENDMGLHLEPEKRLYIKTVKEKIQYYIIAKRTSNVSKTQKRDINTINKLWEDNIGDPVNIIRKTEEIHGAEDGTVFHVYTLPGKPLRLERDLLEIIGDNDKKELMLGICKGLASIHSYSPPLYHRNICPDSFYIFQIKGHYKPLLARFELAKDTDSDITFTVFRALEKKTEENTENVFFAPEVLDPMMRMKIDWEKADAYSLAKTCLFIISKNDKIEDPITNMDDYSWISDEVLLILESMLEENPQKRPGVTTLLSALLKE